MSRALHAWYSAERVLRRKVIGEANTFLESSVLSLEATMRALAESNTSLARFGDGEIYLMLRPSFDIAFQRNTPALRQELRAIIQEEHDSNLLIGLPPSNPDGWFWPHFWAKEWYNVQPLLSANRSYANSFVTRPEAFRTLGTKAVALWNDVWTSKRVLIITGVGSRFQLTNELFSSAKSIDFLPAPDKHAYDAIDSIEDEAMAHSSDLILISLGPTGTVLAHRLARSGHQAIDLGHLTSSYHAVYSGAPAPELT